MRRTCQPGVLATLLLGLLLSGCSKGKPPQVSVPPDEPVAAAPDKPVPAAPPTDPVPAAPAVAQPETKLPVAPPPSDPLPPGPTRQEQYEAALLAALSLQSERKYPQALAALEAARALPHKLDGSDVVQQTLLEAHRKREQFRGHTGGLLLVHPDPRTRESDFSPVAAASAVAQPAPEPRP